MNNKSQVTAKKPSTNDSAQGIIIMLCIIALTVMLIAIFSFWTAASQLVSRYGYGLIPLGIFLVILYAASIALGIAGIRVAKNILTKVIAVATLVVAAGSALGAFGFLAGFIVSLVR